MAISGKTISDSWLHTAQARRLGFKPNRGLSVREHSLISGNPTPAIDGSLAFLIAAGFITSASRNQMPLLIAPDRKTVYEFNSGKERFELSEVEYSAVHAVNWGCIAPIFGNLVPPSDPAQRSYGSFSAFDDGRLQFEALKHSDLEDFREMVATDECLALEEDKPYFNRALSRPIAAEELQTVSAFRAAFPSEEEIEEARRAPSAGSEDEHGALEDIEGSNEAIGRIVISYRHQEYSANRITFDDWLCACPQLQVVHSANGWHRVRFWTDARLRLMNAKHKFTLPWACMGLEPYSLGPVVVLNLARLPSISDRFWLTLERKTGAHHYGTWLADDAGDVFFYKLQWDEDVYARAVLTSVTTTQGITWKEDRKQILKATWEDLDVENVEEAMEMLRESWTYEAREDYVDEDLEDVEIAEKGDTLQWCGDVEGLIDPPTLRETFGSIGKRTNDMKMRVVGTDKVVKGMRVVIVVLQGSSGQRSEFLAKRLFVDEDGEIRARSTPRLVESDYADELLATGKARELDLRRERPAWMTEAMLGMDKT